jgi:hypothetical protein
VELAARQQVAKLMKGRRRFWKKKRDCRLGHGVHVPDLPQGHTEY